MNEDTLQNTYTAAIRDMIEDAEEIMTAVKESAGLVMEPENRAALDRIELEIIDLQNAVLELHKAKQQRSVTAADYAAQIKEYSQRMQELEAQQAELQTTENRYAEVKLWLDSFAEHIQSGAIMNADDSMIADTITLSAGASVSSLTLLEAPAFGNTDCTVLVTSFRDGRQIGTLNLELTLHTAYLWPKEVL